MADVVRPVVLVLAAADSPQLPQLVAVLSTFGLECVACSQAAQAFIRLARHDAVGGPIEVAIILDAVSGMTVPALAKALRGLPGRTGLPLLLLVDEQMQAPPRAMVLRRTATMAELARLAATPPERWAVGEAAAPEPPRPAPVVGTGVLLVVDDHEVNRTMLCLQARGTGLPIETCTDGAAAVARVAAGGVRLVLMDCQMPVMDGYDATRAIRRAEAGSARRLPIIAVTAHAMADNRQRCLEAGMDDFLTKPLAQERLLMAIGRWLGVQPDAPPATAAGPATPAVLDPRPMITIDASSPGTGRQLASILQADLQPAREAFERLLAADDLEQLGRAAHRLKGTSGSLGAMELYQACSVLDQAARHRDRAACGQAVAAAAESIAHLQPVLAAFIGTLPKG